jgi:UTP--glucose-1-phosphate uridylyltransferase
MKVRKAVIPAAGLGTRFLPVTKSVPKELLPILDRPMLQYVVEEAAEAGIEEVIVVTSRGKESIAAYFKPQPDLEQRLDESGSPDLAE